MSSYYDLYRRIYNLDEDDVEQQKPQSGKGELVIRDEGIPQSKTVGDIDFVGDGVVAVRQPDGRIVVRVDLPPSSGGGSDVVTKANFSGVTIPQFASVSERSDGAVALTNSLSSADEDFYGIALEEIVHGATGDIQIKGEVIDGLLALSPLSTETPIFVTPTIGALGTVAPTSSGTLVYRAGYATSVDGRNLLIDKRKIIRNP